MSESQPKRLLKHYLLETYELPAKHNVGRFEKDLRHKAALTNHLIFNLRCKSESLISKSLGIRSPVKTTSGARIAEKAFLLERIRLTHHHQCRVKEQLGDRKPTKGRTFADGLPEDQPDIPPSSGEHLPEGKRETPK